MFCKYCGKEINDDANICPYCSKITDNGYERLSGRSTSRQNVQKSYEVEEPKTAIGVLLGLFLGLIGLVIGLLLYPSNTIRRETFIKGWVGAFVAEIVFAIIIYVAAIGCVATAYRY